MLAAIDDRTVGLVLRALRRRRGWRQSDVADRIGCSQALVSLIERGHVDRSTVESIRRMFEALDARLHLAPTWGGAELDRLLDHDHGLVEGAAAKRLEHAGWTVHLEMTYEIGRERGSIDILGLHPAARAAFVGEAKTDVASSEAVGRKLDEKARFAPEVVRRRFGWTPVVVATVLVMPESPRLRRLVGGSPELRRMFPVASRAVEAWPRKPAGALAATWFLSGIALGNPRRVRRRQVPRRRVGDHNRNETPSVDDAHDAPPGTVFRDRR